MKKSFKYFFLIITIFFNTRVFAEELVLYDEVFNSLTEIQTKWQSNNTRVFNANFIRDGEDNNIFKYLQYSNYYCNSDYVQSSSDKRCLTNDQYLTITISGLNIKSSDYSDIRLFIDYATSSSADALIKDNALLVYTIDSNNTEHGPFYLNDFIPTGYYKKKNEETYYRGFNLVTDDLVNQSNYTITKIKIVPYGNIPRVAGFNGDWRVHSKAFYVKEIKVLGYKSQNYSNENITKKSFNVDEYRENTAKRILDLATIKWKPSDDMSSIHTVGGFRFKYSDSTNGIIDNLYDNSYYYYGPPYTQRNRVLPEKFVSVLNSSKIYQVEKENYYLVKDETNNTQYHTFTKPADETLIVASNVSLQSRDSLGDDCSSSVAYSVNKYLPLEFVYTPPDFIWNNHRTKLLGNIKIDPQANTSVSVYTSTYTKYLEKLNNNTLSHVLLPSAQKYLSQRLKSNDARMWFFGANSDTGNMHRMIGYSEMKSTNETPAIDGDDPLILEIDNLNLESGKMYNFSFNYFFNINNNGGTKDERLANNVILKYCNSSTCSVATSGFTQVGSDTVINSTYTSRTLSINFTPSSKVTRIELYPYGSGTKQGRVFRLENIEIKDNTKTYYYTSATSMDAYFDLTNNIEDGLINNFIVDLINNTISQDNKNELIASFLSKQDIFNGYKELKIGDIVSMYKTNGEAHVRLVTGNTHVTCLDGTSLPVSKITLGFPSGNCDGNGGMDPIKSYYIRTDINSVNNTGTYGNRNFYGGLLNSDDYTVNWTPNQNYTDLKSGDIRGVKRSGESNLFLEGKNINFFINTKNTFQDGFDKGYLPVTLDDYTTGKKEEPYTVTFNKNTYSDIKNGFKGTIYSNYPIISVNYYMKAGNVEKEFEVYPNNSATSKESLFVNYFSLYYNTPEEVQNALRSTIGNTENYEVRIGANIGEEEDVEILSLIPKTIKDFRVVSPPTKMTYVQDSENLDLTGGVVRVTYNDDTFDNISMTNSAIQVSGFDNHILGPQTLDVNYQGQITHFIVEIITKQVKSISMKTNPTKTTYIQNTETLDKTGGVVLITYNDNSTDEISLLNENVVTKDFDNTTLGTNTITVKYSGKTTTFDVQIIGKQVSSIEMKNQPTKTSYIKDSESLDVTGGSIKVTYTDNTTSEVSLTSNDIELTGFDNSSVGSNTITVKYCEKTTTFNVQIIERQIVSISVKTNPSKVNYVQNHDQFDRTGGILLITYDDNSTSEIALTNSNVEITGFNNSNIGTNALTIKYGGKTTTLNVQIISKQIVKISMKELPLKKTYILNKETLDKNGGIVLVTYSDNSTNEISLTNQDIETSGFNNTVLGVNHITVKYLDFETTFDVNIVDKQIKKVELKTKPLKSYYVTNKEELDLTGGIMIVTYDDDTTEEISLLNQDVSIVSFKNSDIGKQIVKLEYNGQIIEYEIEVINENHENITVNPKTGTIIFKLILLLVVTSIVMYFILKSKKFIKL